VLNLRTHRKREISELVSVVDPKVLLRVEFADMYKSLVSGVMRKRKEYRSKRRRQTFKQRSMVLRGNDLLCATQGSCCRIQSVRDQLAQSYSRARKAYENCCM
jgi:hypothetical protein